ncbi:hypothetical protein ACFLWR_01450 [Chloroflexota bacterium]
MPRLTDEFNKFTEALGVLLQAYRRHTDFENELQQIYVPYRFLVLGFVLQFLEGGPGIKSHKDAIILTDNEYNAMLSNLEVEFITDRAKQFPKVTQNDQAQLETRMDAACLSVFLKDLDELADKWKLRIPALHSWLFIELAIDEIKAAGLIFKIGQSFHPHYKTARGSMQVTVHDWFLAQEGQKPILKQIERLLSDRLAMLKADGLSERLSSIEQHAQWWFDYYVLDKKYKELARQYPSPKDTDPEERQDVNREEVIRNAVSKFSKLLQIRTKT